MKDRRSILVVEGIPFSLHHLHTGSAEVFFTALAYSLPYNTEIKSVWNYTPTSITPNVSVTMFSSALGVILPSLFHKFKDYLAMTQSAEFL